MADPNIDIDEQIQELMYIKLGLQKKSENIFKQLLSSEKDPLDDIYRKMTSLRRQVALLTQENNKYKREKGQIASKDPKKTENVRSWSLPASHHEDKQMIQQKKQDVQSMRRVYQKKSEQFSIFLIKCIREVSKSTFKTQADAEKIVSKVQDLVKKEKKRCFEGQPADNKSQSEVSTEASFDPNNKLVKLIKQLNGKKDTKAIFQKVSEHVGLQNKWNQYITQLQLDKQMYEYLRDNLLGIEKQKLKGKNRDQLKYLLSYHSSQWAEIAEKQRQYAVKNAGKEAFINIANEVFENTRKELEKSNQKACTILIHTIVYFFEKLDKMFTKHNQYPYQISKRPQLKDFEQSLRTKYKNGMVDVIQKSVQDEINQAFYMIERRTKFYSTNRAIFRNGGQIPP